MQYCPTVSGCTAPTVHCPPRAGPRAPSCFIHSTHAPSCRNRNVTFDLTNSTNVYYLNALDSLNYMNTLYARKVCVPRCPDAESMCNVLGGDLPCTNATQYRCVRAGGEGAAAACGLHARLAAPCRRMPAS